MRKGQTWLGLAAVVLVAVVVGSVVLLRGRHHRGHAVSATGPIDEDSETRWRGFASAVPGIAPSPPPGVPTTPVGQAPGVPHLPGPSDEVVMDRWRHAVVERRAEEILDIDQDFALEPARFGPLLERSAETDPDDRVRAFSTRVLGKYKNVAAAHVFDRLLSDKSEFVRQNAAWGLGQLAARPGGRAAANDSAAQLRHLQNADPASDVRAAAADALKNL